MKKPKDAITGIVQVPPEKVQIVTFGNKPVWGSYEQTMAHVSGSSFNSDWQRQIPIVYEGIQQPQKNRRGPFSLFRKLRNQ